MFITVGTGN